jgi:hypothetical protein
VQMRKQVRHLLPPPAGSSSFDFSPAGAQLLSREKNRFATRVSA